MYMKERRGGYSLGQQWMGGQKELHRGAYLGSSNRLRSGQFLPDILRRSSSNTGIDRRRNYLLEPVKLV